MFMEVNQPMQSRENKNALFTVKVAPTRLEEFRIAATLRGTTMSALVQQFMTQVVREEMVAVPEAFRRRHQVESSSLVDLINPHHNGGDREN
jgi:hypothetical protein